MNRMNRMNCLDGDDVLCLDFAEFGVLLIRD
jgi:hypothetical protein